MRCLASGKRRNAPDDRFDATDGRILLSECRVALDDDQAREIIYGMPYSEWRTRYQAKSAPETIAAYKDNIDKYGEAGERWFDEEV